MQAKTIHDVKRIVVTLGGGVLSGRRHREVLATRVCFTYENPLNSTFMTCVLS